MAQNRKANKKRNGHLHNAEAPVMAYQFMHQHQGQCRIMKMARELGVSRSGYYAWFERKPCQHESEDRELLELIIKIFYAHYRRYGSPQVWAELRDTHQRHRGRKRVERLMREHGLQARRRRKFVATTDSSGWLYLTIILDLWDRTVIGWAFSEDMAAYHVCRAAESFFKTLKWELDVLEGRHTKTQVRTAVFEFIEIYYSKGRRHSAIGYATPVAFTNAA